MFWSGLSCGYKHDSCAARGLNMLYASVTAYIHNFWTVAKYELELV